MGGWERQRLWGNEGGNERESRDGESKTEYSESGEVKPGGGREKGAKKKDRKGERRWKATLKSSFSHLGKGGDERKTERNKEKWTVGEKSVL